ncbi:hypothetical protein A6V36_10630 [Paraburkholderia ginsengiterrae]|uniref:Uncharacterized protein n=1 Tax=Paraburkholderia ginsengiterrae TaxID=1462993 RepID=A0ABX2UMK9_9BURK|nr:hypothetical protein A6V36_10630 [Paraburkholderia ginsengiterrae]
MSRKDILGQWAKFSFQTEEGAPVRTFRGFISRFHSVSRSPDGCTYRVVIRQRLAMLDGPSNCVTYQNRTSADIVQAVIERNDMRPWIRVEQRLRRQHPKHAFRFQYNMGDLAYCRLEMEQDGLFWFTEDGQHGEVLVIADDIDGYTRPAIELKARPGAGLHTFEESVYSLKVKTKAVPDSFIVADYNPENALTLFREEGKARDEFSREQHDGTTLGTPYVWGTQHGDAEGAKREAVLRHEAARAQQVTCKAKSTMPLVRPGCVVKPDALEAYATEAGKEFDAKDTSGANSFCINAGEYFMEVRRDPTTTAQSPHPAGSPLHPVPVGCHVHPGRLHERGGMVRGTGPRRSAMGAIPVDPARFHGGIDRG